MISFVFCPKAVTLPVFGRGGGVVWGGEGGVAAKGGGWGSEKFYPDANVRRPPHPFLF